MTRRQLQTHSIAICIGLSCTLAVTIAYRLGHLDWLESGSLDLRFLYASSMSEADNIRCIDIDDEALELVGRWPWSRDKQAAIIDVLAELGAKSILIDINWVEPQPLGMSSRTDAAAVGDPTGVPLHEDDQRFPDLELSAALRRAGNTFLAVLFEAKNPEDENTGAALFRVRVSEWLNETDSDPAALKSWWPDLFYAMFPDGQIQNQTTGKSQLWSALLYALGYNATMRGDFVTPQRVRPAPRRVDEITPVHFPIARAGRGFGFVVFDPDSDGVVRRQVVLTEHNNRILPQLALAVACDAVGAGPEDIWVQPAGQGRPTHWLHLNRPAIAAEPLAIQLDDAGRMMIPWIERSDWTTHFAPHVPAAALWQVYDRRLLMADNHRNIRDITELTLAERVEDPEAYAELLGAFKALERELVLLRLTASADRINEAGARLAAQRDEIESIESKAIQGIESRLAELLEQPSRGGLIEKETLKLLVSQLRKTQPFEQANRELQVEIDGVLDWLRPLIRGNICLLGYTATALGDMTPTPINKRTPGVMVHANIINGILTGRTVRWVSAGTNAALAILFGVFITVVTTWRRSLASLSCTALLSAGWIVVTAAAFYTQTLWIALTPVIGTMLVSYVAISGYRYAFADRERRQLASALGQYTSKTIARLVAEDPELCKRAESREVTAIFTDLQGFTSISERIGAKRTQRVLNICLGEFTEIMLRHEAMVNKFMGDGIFAFWNPVIYPQPDHALLACETAVDLMAGLEVLIRDQKRAGGDPAISELVMRMGLATGNAIVGPCGSDKKYDYTCIGDSVNVASRLESANKFYGTHILVNGATHDAVGERFAFRSLGGVRVKGKQKAVPIYELLGRSGEVDQRALAYAEAFGRAVGEFQQRAFEPARLAFRDCAAQRPQDLAAVAYASEAERLIAEPPGADWNGALKMLEK